MREILFRGKRKDNGEWVEGLLWKKKYNTDKLFISCFPDKDDNEDVFVIHPETVGQFTGFTDKNGAKIFEGDIVRIGNKYIRYIEYSGECAAFVKFRYIDNLTSEFSGYLGKGYDNYKQTVEIIGNIHDTPELLKESYEKIR